MTPTLSEAAACVAWHLETHPGTTTERVLAIVVGELTWYGTQDSFLVMALHRAGTRMGFGQDADGLWYTDWQRPDLAAAFAAQRPSPGAHRLGLALEAVARVGTDGIDPGTESVLREALHFEAASPVVDTTDRKETA